MYLAARGRGAATLSTALNSNTLNVIAGLLLPAAVIGLGRPSGQVVLITVWYVVLTAVILASAWRYRGLGRGAGILIIAAYAVFTVSVLASAHPTSPDTRLVAALGATVAALAAWAAFARRTGVGGAGRTWPRRRPPGRRAAGQPPGASPAASGNGHRHAGSSLPAPGPPVSPMRRESLLPGWSVGRLWALGLALSVFAAAAVLGRHVVLIGLLIAGPCCVLLTGRWVPTGLTGLWVTGLAVVLGLPDGIWGAAVHLAFLGAVAVVAAVNTVAAAVISNARP